MGVSKGTSVDGCLGRGYLAEVDWLIERGVVREVSLQLHYSQHICLWPLSHVHVLTLSELQCSLVWWFMIPDRAT